MSKITTELRRSNDRWIVKVSIPVQFDGDYEKLNLQFRSSNQENVYILNSSNGHISDNVIVSNKVEFLTADLLHVDGTIECVLSYFSNNNMIHCDVSMINMAKLPLAQSSKPNLRKKGAGVTKWKIEINMAEDLILSILASDKSPLMIAFGEGSDSLEHTDVIFTAYPSINKMIIPKEILWSRYNEYKSHELGCYEVVKSRKIENMYYKLLISNIVNISGIEKIDYRLSNFQYPTGVNFDPNKWRIGDSYLPEIT